MKRNLALFRGYTGPVQRLVQMRQVLLQRAQRVSALDLHAHCCGAVMGSLDAHLHGAEFGGLQMDRHLAAGTGGNVHAGNSLSDLRNGCYGRRRRMGGR
jgi:hypothetical protein